MNGYAQMGQTSPSLGYLEILDGLSYCIAVCQSSAMATQLICSGYDLARQEEGINTDSNFVYGADEVELYFLHR